MPPDRRDCQNDSPTSRAGPTLLMVSVLAALLLVGGCASFGRRGPVPDEVAACRELSRQGAAAIEMGQWKEAESLLLRAVEASPSDAEPRRYLAETMWHRGSAEQALAQIERAVELDPRDASLKVRAGEMRLAVGAKDKALAYAEEAIRLDAKLASAWALRGRVFWQLNQTDRALADLQRALQFSPNNAELLLDVAVLYRQRRQLSQCLATLHYLIDTYPPGDEPQLPLLLEGLTLAEMQRPAQAAQSLVAASRRGPPNVEVFYQLASVRSAMGDYTAATTAAEEALSIDPNHQPSRQLLVQLASHVAPAQPQQR